VTWWVRDVTVRYDAVLALDAVSLELEAGAFHAVVGGDGAGKTTLLKVLAGLDVGQTGSSRLPAPERIGYVPSAGGVFVDLTVDENMAFVAAAYRLRGWRERADELLDRAAIGRFADRLAGHLSGGERRKLAGSMALLPEPDLLVLDEVTTGVDPVSRLELWRLLTAAAADGAAIVVATTYLDEAERMEHVLLLHDGVVLANGTPDEIAASVPGTVVEVDDPSDRASSWRAGHRWHAWRPDADPAGSTLALGDAAIVLELIAGDAAARTSAGSPS
jgi:ABC-2 type transport system ATP-binding protein